MADVNTLCTLLEEKCKQWITLSTIALDELTIEVQREHLLSICKLLRDDEAFDFKLLVDVCGVDYLHYGLDQWQTESATETGFSRGCTKHYIAETGIGGETRGRQLEGVSAAHDSKLVDEFMERHLEQEDSGKKVAATGNESVKPQLTARFAVVYHLLSLKHNHRIRLRVNIPNDQELIVDSVIHLWPSADWYEREAFDLFGILFKGHPDLRRLLTDYGFNGHPFRKDFPLIGKVEARYDGASKRVVYEPVSIEMRVLEPKVIRHDNRLYNEKEDMHE